MRTLNVVCGHCIGRLGLRGNGGEGGAKRVLGRNETKKAKEGSS